MKRSLLSLFLLALVIAQTSVLGQGVKQLNDVNVELSKPFAVIDAENKLYLCNENHVIALKLIKNGTIYIQSFDKKTMNLTAVNFYKDLDKKSVFEYFSVVKGRFYVFYSLYDAKSKHEQLFSREIDPKSAKFISQGQLIISVPDKLSGDLIASSIWYTFKVINKFGFTESKDGERILIYYKQDPKTRNDSKSYNIIGLHVFDQNIKELWSKTIEMPYTEKKMNILDHAVNDNGDIFILSKVYNDDTEKDRKHRNDENPNYHFALFVIDSNSKNLIEKTIEVGEKFINSVIIKDISREFMTIAGYYKNPETNYGVDGLFVFKVKSDGVLFDKSYHDIPLGILNQNATKREVKKNSKKEEDGGNASFTDLELCGIKTQQDGSIILTGEKQYVVTHTHVDANGRTYTSYTYHYDDILITKISAKGELIWMHKIPKRQVGRHPLGGLSFEYLTNSKNHYLLYLDNIKNLDLPKDESPSKFTDGTGSLMSTKLDNATGKSTKEVLFDLRNVNGIEVHQFEKKRIIQLSDSEIAVEVYKKKKEDIWIRVKIQ